MGGPSKPGSPLVQDVTATPSADSGEPASPPVQRPLRYGVIIDSESLEAWQMDVLENLVASGNAKLVALILPERKKEPGRFSFSRPGEFVRCPWHGWEYDLKTGQSWCDPDDIKVKTYAARIEPGEELVKGPYVVDTFPVTVEEDYVVVEV